MCRSSSRWDDFRASAAPRPAPSTTTGTSPRPPLWRRSSRRIGAPVPASRGTRRGSCAGVHLLMGAILLAEAYADTGQFDPSRLGVGRWESDLGPCRHRHARLPVLTKGPGRPRARRRPPPASHDGRAPPGPRRGGGRCAAWACCPRGLALCVVDGAPGGDHMAGKREEDLNTEPMALEPYGHAPLRQGTGVRKVLQAHAPDLAVLGMADPKHTVLIVAPGASVDGFLCVLKGGAQAYAERPGALSQQGSRGGLVSPGGVCGQRRWVWGRGSGAVGGGVAQRGGSSFRESGGGTGIRDTSTRGGGWRRPRRTPAPEPSPRTRRRGDFSPARRAQAPGTDDRLRREDTP